MVRYNLSSSIDSPYKRIYHYLQWKEEHEDKNKTVRTEDTRERTAKETANVTIRNRKKPAAEKSKETPLDSPASGNETMKSENIMVAIPNDDANGVVVVDRETGKEVRVAKNKQAPVLIKQSKDKSRSKISVVKKPKAKAKVDKPEASDNKRKDSNSNSNQPPAKS